MRDPLDHPAVGEVDIADAIVVLWRGKWAIFGITALFTLCSIGYALTLTHWYRSEMLLAPPQSPSSTSGLAAQLGSLASIAGFGGVSLGATENSQALAVLQSRDFTEEFIEEQELLTVLFSEQWDAESQTWLNADPDSRPDIRDAVKYFDENVRSVEEDVNGYVTLQIDWKDPDLAARWAELLVTKLNGHMRAKVLSEAQKNYEYLQEQLASTSVVALQQSISRLVESELQRLMLAQGNEEFAFRILDHADVPKAPFRPNRKMLVIFSTFLGGLFGIIIVYVMHIVRGYRQQT